MKKLIAYSSVAHMAIVTIGLFAFNTQGLEGAMIVMLSHGLVSGALFLAVGVIYDRLHTREIDRYGGLSINMPYYALFLLLFTMASIGLPGTSGFVGEFLSLGGIYQMSSWVALVCTTGIILGAAYMLYLYRRVAFGEQKNADAAAMPDLDRREWLMMAPLAAAVLWMGVYPESFMAPMRADVQVLLDRLDRARPQGDAHLIVRRDPRSAGIKVRLLDGPLVTVITVAIRLLGTLSLHRIRVHLGVRPRWRRWRDLAIGVIRPRRRCLHTTRQQRECCCEQDRLGCHRGRRTRKAVIMVHHQCFQP